VLQTEAREASIVSVEPYQLFSLNLHVSPAPPFNYSASAAKPDLQYHQVFFPAGVTSIKNYPQTL
jgi:hypothetical protein